MQVYTYPLTIEDGTISNSSFQDLTQIESNWSSTNQLILTQPIHYRKEVWDEIEISHTVAVASNIPASQTYKANSIVLKPGANIFPGVTLKSGLPLPDRTEAQPKNERYVNNFCHTIYRGHEYSGTISASARTASPESTELLSTHEISALDSLSNGVIIYPNPNSGKFHISFEEPTTSCQEVKILSANNELLYRKLVKGSINDLEINLDLPLGDNYVKFYFNEGIVTKRIWIQ